MLLTTELKRQFPNTEKRQKVQALKSKKYKSYFCHISKFSFFNEPYFYQIDSGKICQIKATFNWPNHSIKIVFIVYVCTI